MCTVPESLETAQTFLVPLRVTSKARTPRRLFFSNKFAREEHCDSVGRQRLCVGIGMGVENGGGMEGWGGRRRGGQGGWGLESRLQACPVKGELREM